MDRFNLSFTTFGRGSVCRDGMDNHGLPKEQNKNKVARLQGGEMLRRLAEDTMEILSLTMFLAMVAAVAHMLPG